MAPVGTRHPYIELFMRNKYRLSLAIFVPLLPLLTFALCTAGSGLVLLLLVQPAARAEALLGPPLHMLLELALLALAVRNLVLLLPPAPGRTRAELVAPAALALSSRVGVAHPWLLPRER